MPKQSEIDRMLVMFYRSNNAHDWTNFVRPAGWLDKLPMKGLEEFSSLMETIRQDVEREISARKAKGHPRYPPSEYDGKNIQ